MTEVVKCGVVVYQGSKLFWRTRNTIDVTIVEHRDCDVTEIIAYEPSINVEAERIYLNSNILRTKLDQVEMDSKFSFAKQNNVPISVEFTDSVMNHAITDFIIPRLIISEFAREERRFVVNLEFRSSDGDNIDELVCAKAASLHPFETKNHKLLAPGEVDAAFKALEEEKRRLDATCAKAAILEAEAHAPLSGKERWRIPLVLIKMDKGKVLSAGDAKIGDHVSRSLKTQADIKRATEITVQTATSPAQQAAEKAVVKPLNSFRQVVNALKPFRLNLTKVNGAGVGAGAGVGNEYKVRDSRSREKSELSSRRNSSPRNSGRIAASAGVGADAKARDSRSREKSELSSRRNSSPRNSGRIAATSSRLLAGTATSQARAQCAAEDNHPTPRMAHKKAMKRAGSRNGHSNNTSKRSLRMSANSESRDNSDAAGDLCASPDADHSGILDYSAPLGAIGENARAGFVNQVAAGLSSFAASFSAKNKAPAASYAASKEVNEESEPKTERYNSLVEAALGKDNACTEVATRHNSLKPSVETTQAGADAGVGAHAKNGAVRGKRGSYFGALLASLVRGDSSESLTNANKADDLPVQDNSLSKKPSGMSSWLPWRPFGNNAVVPAE